MRYIAAVFFLILFGCNKPDNNIQKNLIGAWELDSISTVRAGIQKRGNLYETIKFLDEEDFNFEWMHGDVGGEYKGKYYIHYNPRRGLKTVFLLPDTINLAEGTLRTKYKAFDILELKNNRLVTLDESDFIARKDGPYILNTKKKIFKKKLNPTTAKNQ